jgi:hypothetical protein
MEPVHSYKTSWISTELHGIASQKIVTAVRTSNASFLNMVSWNEWNSDMLELQLPCYKILFRLTLHFSRMWHHVISWMITNILEEHAMQQYIHRGCSLHIELCEDFRFHIQQNCDLTFLDLRFSPHLMFNFSDPKWIIPVLNYIHAAFSQFIGFEALTAVAMKSTIFWDITPCSSLSVNWRFGWTYRLHLQGQKISQAWNQRESRWQTELCLQQTTHHYTPEDSTFFFSPAMYSNPLMHKETLNASFTVICTRPNLKQL